MTLYAVDDIGDAIEATKEYLLPVDRSRWLRLALVVLFVGGGLGMQFPANFGTGSVDFGGGDAPATEGDFDPSTLPSELPGPITAENVWLLVGALVAVAILLSLLLGFIGAVMEFVFVESLHRDAVHVRRYFGRYWRSGLRLFGFRLGVSVLGLLVVALVGAAVALAAFGGIPTDPGAAQIVGAIVVLVPVMLITFALVSLVNGLTTAFVVPIMLAEDRSVIDSWRRFWPTLRGQLKQYGVYVLMAFILTIAVGILTATAMGAGAIALAIPFLIVGGIVVAVSGHLSLAVGVALAALVVLYVLLVVALLALIQVPLQTFLRLYSLLVLGDSNEAFDVIGDLRADIRD
ncbi:DUF7544 domain-containing protein [Halorientalis salina]|uniref:DUF7544 domain-containing protein n=1 Tax=Halorientalis salina TaxID=2932266 RepID=UPI0010AC7475|nr:hypothetical protein [Halorientalis salina]